MKTPASKPDFEDFLAAQKFRRPPPEWREAILAAAQQAAQHHAEGEAPPLRRRLVLLPRLRSGWGALAAVWVVLALLHFDTPPAPVYGGKEPRPTLADLERQFAHHRAMVTYLLAEIAPARGFAVRTKTPSTGHPPHAPATLPIAPPIP